MVQCAWRSLPVLALLFATAALAEVNPCDLSLIQPPNNPYGYRLRGDRCEGVYVEQVGGEDLSIVSWTESFQAYDLSSTRPLQIEWDSPDKTEVRLIAHALRRRLYYRMDAISPAGTQSYRWKNDLLASLGINNDELGVLASANLRVGDSTHQVYLPLRIAQSGRPAHASQYDLVVVPGEEASEMYVSITDETHSDHALLKKDEPLGYGYYPAGRAVKIPIARPSSPGIYQVEIGATFRSGAVSTTELWFYNPRR
jgi:hypothetical protein